MHIHTIASARRPSSRRPRSFALAVACLCLVAPATVHAAGRPGGTGGGPPSGGSQILPTNLGASPSCSGSHGLALNDGTTYGLYVAGYGQSCAGVDPQAFRWSAGTGMVELGTLSGSTGSFAEGVSDDGTTVGWTGGGAGLAFVVPPGEQSPLALPLLPGMVYATASGISSNGAYIVGSNSTDSDLRSVLWEQRSDGSWSATDLGPASWGYDLRVNNDGSIVGTKYVLDPATGGAVRSGRIWTRATGAWVNLPGTETEAHDISGGGTVIVGIRWQSCAAPCGEYEVPVRWQLVGGTWTGPYDLQALDGVDSEALGVGEVNGRAVIVGYGYTKKDAIMRAVAWVPDASGVYGAPIRLAAIGGKAKSWASASDVNSSGQVVGTSAGNGLTVYAVLWTLPQ